MKYQLIAKTNERNTQYIHMCYYNVMKLPPKKVLSCEQNYDAMIVRY